MKQGNANEDAQEVGKLLSLNDYRFQKRCLLHLKSYAEYLKVLSVADLFHEAKFCMDEIQEDNLSLSKVKKAQTILEEIALRIQGDSPELSDSLKLLRSEISCKLKVIQQDLV